MLNLYGNDYFGKDKALRRKPSIKLKTINLRDIIQNLPLLIKKGIAKEIRKGEYELNLLKYKILSEGELKEKLKITASAASKSAIDKVKKAGGDIILKGAN